MPPTSPTRKCLTTKETLRQEDIENKTEVTSVKLVLFKYVMSFETLTKVDQLTEIVRFGYHPEW